MARAVPWFPRADGPANSRFPIVWRVSPMVAGRTFCLLPTVSRLSTMAARSGEQPMQVHVFFALTRLNKRVPTTVQPWLVDDAEARNRTVVNMKGDLGGYPSLLSDRDIAIVVCRSTCDAVGSSDIVNTGSVGPASNGRHSFIPQNAASTPQRRLACQRRSRA